MTSFGFQKVFGYATNNVIMKLLFNKTYEYDDEAFLEFYFNLSTFYSLLNPMRANWVLPYFVSKHLKDTQDLLKAKQGMCDTAERLLQELKPKSEEVDVDESADCVAEHMWKTSLTKEGLPFPQHEVAPLLFEFLMAGQGTTTVTFAWIILSLLHYPEVQQRVYEELREEFPDKEAIIPLTSSESCPVTMATISEVQRRTPALVSAIDHTADVDIENFHGYRVPKGTRMMPSMTVVYRDPKLWKYPDEFNPDNFLDENGQYVKSPYLIPYMIGLRACPGDNIARWELFVLFANLMRRFKINPVGTPPPMTSEILFVVEAPTFSVTMEERPS